MKEESLFSSSTLSVNKAGNRLSDGVSRWWQFLKDFAISHGEIIILITLGFLLGRATLMEEVAVFGAIFWLLLLRERPAQSYLVGGTVFLGRASALGWFSAFHLLIAMFLVWLWEALCLRLWQKKSPLIVSVGALTFMGSAFLAGGFAGAFDKAVLGLEMLIGILIAITLYPSVHLADSLPRIRDRPKLNTEEILAIFLLFSLALLGLGEMGIAGVSLLHFLGKISLLVSAYIMGAGAGAALGVIVGTILGLGSPHLYLIIGSLAFSGFWAGFMRQFGRIGAASGYILSFPFFALLEPEVFSQVYKVENLLALGVFLVIPVSVFNWLSLKVSESSPVEFRRKEEASLDIVTHKIDRLAVLFNELGESFNQVNERKKRPVEAEMAPVVKDLFNRFCKSCSRREWCWHKNFRRNYRWAMKLIANVEGEIKEHHLPPEIKAKCRHPTSLLSAVNCSKEVWRANRFWVNKLTKERKIIGEQLQGVSQIMLEMNHEMKASNNKKGKERAAPLFTLELGVAQKARDDDEICGDYYSFIEVRDNLHALVLSDGMGHGQRAHMESKAAVKLVERMLEAGFEKEMVIRVANSLLQLRSQEEVFATADLALINLGQGELESVKIGAAESYWKRGGEIEKVGSSTLPMGILSALEVESYSKKVQVGDLYVMVSDGIGEDREDWLQNFLYHCEYSHPEIVAHRILEEAKYRNSHKEKDDDMTVIACRIIPINQQLSREGENISFKRNKEITTVQ